MKSWKNLKVGDLVRVVYKDCPFFGEIGEVVKIKKSVVDIKIGDKMIRFGSPSSLEEPIWSVS